MCFINNADGLEFFTTDGQDGRMDYMDWTDGTDGWDGREGRAFLFRRFTI